MVTIARTDIHRPSAPEFDPQAYECRGVFDLQSRNPRRQAMVNALLSLGASFTSVHGPSQCGHCGAHIRYAALMLHRPTNGLIYVGETCLDNRFESLTRSEFQALRQQARLNSRRETVSAKAAEVVAQHPELAILLTPEALENFSYFVTDIGFKLRTFGSLSDRQIEAVKNALVRDAERAAVAEQRRVEEEARKAVAAPAPSGRVEITGEIVYVKAYDEYRAMRVRGDEGWTVWLTVPCSIDHLTREELVSRRVRVTATWTPSADDITFAKGRQPRNAVLV